MKVNETKLKNSVRVEVEYQIDPPAIEEAYIKAYKKNQSKVNISGFRKGKAPLNRVAQHLGESVASDVIELLVDESFRESIPELKYPPISEPQFSVKDYDRKKYLKYTIQYDTSAEIKIGKYKKVKVKLDKIKITDQDVDDEILILQKQYAKYEECDDAVSNSQKLTLDIQVLQNDNLLNKDTDVPFPTRAEGKPPVGSKDIKDAIEENLWDKKTGDEVEMTHTPTVAETGKENNEAITYKLSIKKIEKEILPELSDEFVKDKFKLDNLAELKKDIRKKMDDLTQNNVNEKAFGEILDDIIENSSFLLPQSLVESDINYQVESICKRSGIKTSSLTELANMIGKKEKEFHDELEVASQKRFKNQLIIMEVAKLEELEPTEEDYTKYLEKMSGPEGKDIEKLKEELKKEDREWTIKTELKNNKVKDFLLEKMISKKGTVHTYAEFKKMQEMAAAQ